MGSSSVEACCEAPEVFELVEAAFDPIAVFVEVGVVRDRDLARRERWDDGEHAGIGDELAKMVAVVGFVSNYGAAVDAVKQRRGGDDVVDLSAGENEAQRPTWAVRPGSPGLPGSRPSIRRHCASDNSYRLTMSHAPNHLIRNTRNHRPNAMGILRVL